HALGIACKGVTTEFENVPAESLRILSENCVVSPSARSVTVAQDRILEKEFFVSSGFCVAPYVVIPHSDGPFDVKDIMLQACSGLGSSLFPGILKVSRMGYDGKGQVRVNNAAELAAAYNSLGRESCVLEKSLLLETELSV